MPVFVALLRAVNVGGTGKLPMSDLVAMAKAAGFEREGNGVRDTFLFGRTT